MILDCMFTVLCFTKKNPVFLYWYNFIVVKNYNHIGEGSIHWWCINPCSVFFFCISGQGDVSRAICQNFPHACSIKAATAHNYIVHFTVASALTADVARLIRPTLSQPPSSVQGAACSTKLSWWSSPVFVILTAPTHLVESTGGFLWGDRYSHALTHIKPCLKPRKNSTLHIPQYFFYYQGKISKSWAPG